jgi:hypothetical protein
MAFRRLRASTTTTKAEKPFQYIKRYIFIFTRLSQTDEGDESRNNLAHTIRGIIKKLAWGKMSALSAAGG